MPGPIGRAAAAFLLIIASASAAHAYKLITGVGIVMKHCDHKPPNYCGSSAERIISGADGSFSQSGLAPGLYEISMDGHPPRSVKVGESGRLAGQTTSEGILLPGEAAPPKGGGAQ